MVSFPRIIYLADTVYSERLEGRESDRYASYNNALIGSGYRTGDFCLFNQSTGVPLTANAYGQPDIANGTVTWAFGAKLRTDRDPNKFVAADANAAADYVDGDVIHLQIWNKPKTTATLTLTSGGTLVGAGDAAYIYGTGTLAGITDDFDDVADNGDYFLIADEEPSNLSIQIPTKDVIGSFGSDKVNTSEASSIGDPVSSETKIAVVNGSLLAYISILHLERHFADRYSPYVGYTAVTSSAYDAKGELDVGQLNNANPIVRFAPKDSDLADLEAEITDGTIFEIYHDSANYYLLKAAEVNGKVVRNDSFKTAINGRYVNTSRVEKVGTISATDSFELRVYKKGDGLVPVPSQDDIGKVLEAVGINSYEWREIAIAGISGLETALAGKDPKPTQSNPSITGTESGNTWTTIQANCNDNDRFVLGMIYNDNKDGNGNPTGNWGLAHADIRFGDIGDVSTRKTWLPLPAELWLSCAAEPNWFHVARSAGRTDQQRQPARLALRELLLIRRKNHNEFPRQHQARVPTR